MTRLEKFTKDKHSSLFQKSAIYGQKSFITLGPDVKIIKLSFLLSKLKILTRDKHFSLLGHSANGTARFKNLSDCLNTNIYSQLETSGACTIKLLRQ
jgi:hypothetical protein